MSSVVLFHCFSFILLCVCVLFFLCFSFLFCFLTIHISSTSVFLSFLLCVCLLFVVCFFFRDWTSERINFDLHSFCSFLVFSMCCVVSVRTGLTDCFFFFSPPPHPFLSLFFLFHPLPNHPPFLFPILPLFFTSSPPPFSLFPSPLFGPVCTHQQTPHRETRSGREQTSEKESERASK